MTAVLVFLLLAVSLPAFVVENASADDDEDIPDVEVGPYDNSAWVRIKTDLITILFPAGGRKPMFLWWYSNDTSNIYVVKFKGLIEYMTVDYSYYLRKYMATGTTILERLELKYCGTGPHRTSVQERIWERIYGYMLAKMSFLTPAFLPFSAAQWNLTGPENVTRPDGVSYVSFNFTLKRAPPRFSFADDNVIIRARFYATDATEDVHGLYNYTVRAGELKMDLIVKNWQWNVDRLTELFDDLHDEFGLVVPKTRANLALWTDLASINITDMPVAEEDAYSTSDLIETTSKVSDIIVCGQRIQMHQNQVAMNEDETPMGQSVREHYRLKFAKGSQTLAGFFDFVDKALVIDESANTIEEVNVTAAYISAGQHMRLFIGYPYFGNKTLEHDPSIGVEATVPWLPNSLLLVVIGATTIIAVAISAVKFRKKTVNIITVK